MVATLSDEMGTNLAEVMAVMNSWAKSAFLGEHFL
jgi:hypothetical protein